MSRTLVLLGMTRWCFPRSRGDEPQVHIPQTDTLGFSPLTRG